MTDFADVTVIEGEWSSTKPIVIIEAETARYGLEHGLLEDWVKGGLDALELSGRKVAMIDGSET